MPKKQLAIVDNSKILSIPRAQPPAELTTEEATEWTALTNRMPADYFGREHYPTMIQLCRHTVAARRVAQLIEQHVNSAELAVPAYLQLLKAQELESRAITALLRTMRLTHQSNVPANTSRTPQITVEAPWLD